MQRHSCHCGHCKFLFRRVNQWPVTESGRSVQRSPFRVACRPSGIDPVRAEASTAGVQPASRTGPQGRSAQPVQGSGRSGRRDTAQNQKNYRLNRALQALGNLSLSAVDAPGVENVMDQQTGFGHLQSPSQSTFPGLGADR